MARKVRLTAVQAPHPNQQIRNADMLRAAFALIDEAGILGSDLTLLPELINIYDVAEVNVESRSGPELPGLLSQVSAKARQYNMYIVFPVAETRGEAMYNTSIIFGRDGRVLGRYDKTHLAPQEYELWPKLKPGSSLPTFDLDFGRVGIMTCYDGFFPEIAMSYGLRGVDVLLWPRWMSGPSEITFELQMRMRAIDNFLILVTSSYGVAPGVAWKPGMLFGRSCVIGRDGTILADSGHDAGVASVVVNVDQPKLMDIVDEAFGGGRVEDLAKLLRHDRRPELYGEIVKPATPAAPPP
jgi:predicted amidohydrolase